MAWLKENYPEGTRLTAIIYLHDQGHVLQNALPGNDLTYDKSIRALFGDNVLEKFVFVRTSRDGGSWLIPEETIEQEGFFRGCKCFYVCRDKESALKVLNWAITLG